MKRYLLLLIPVIALCFQAGAHTPDTGYVTGIVFFDTNANCQHDPGENGIAGITVLATNHNITFSGTTNLSGQYTISVTDTGTYAIVTSVYTSSAILQYGGSGCGHMELCPASDTVTFVTLNDTFQNHNFGFVGTRDFDLAIQAGWTPLDSNRLKQYWILYANQAFLMPYTDSATITFNYDPNLSFQYGIPAPANDSINHILTWIVDSLPSPSYIWADRVRAFFTVSADFAPDSQLKNSFHIQPYTGDCDTNNNSVYTEAIAGLTPTAVRKEVSPMGDIAQNDSVLTYIIYFRNSGTDTTRIIKVTDSLSPYLDPESVVNIASSPLFNRFYLAQGVVLTWIFNPVNLPDSAVDAVNSSGFVSFKAKLKPGTRSGYTVRNKAFVYFDNDTALESNTTKNFISFPTAVAELTGSSINVRVFPVPFNSVANVSIEGVNGTYDFELVDITGRLIKSVTSITTNRFQIDRGGLTSGVYIYRIFSNHKPVAFGKLVAE